MNCPQCKAENPDGAKFCSKCGQSMAVPEPVQPPPVTNCPACQAPKADDAKFCGACGYRYDTGAASAASAASTDPAPESVAARIEPVADMQTAPQEPTVVVSPAEEPKKNNNLMIIVAIAVIAIIGVIACGWYLFSSPKAPDTSTASSAPSTSQVQLGQPGADGLKPPSTEPQTQPGQPGADGQPPQASGQPGAVQELDAYGNPVKPEGAAAAPAPRENGQALKKKSDQRRDLTPRYSEQPAAPRGISIDEQHRQRVAVECPTGPSGLFCREKVRYRLCKNHWSASPPPGQSICQRAQ